MTSELDSVDAELFALRAEAEQSPTAARDRIFSRLERSVPALASATVGAHAVSEVADAGRADAVRLALSGKLLLACVFALGGVVGAGTYAAFDHEPESRVVYVDRIVAAPAPKPVGPLLEPARRDTTGHHAEAVEHQTNAAPNARRGASVRDKLERATESVPVGPAAPAALPAVEVADSASLAEQQALLDRARLALGKANGQAALETLELHAHRYPESMLTEEREALTIKALASVGRNAEARSRFELFEKRFSRSPLLPSLGAATGRGVTESNR
jgi:hypothetical protein